MQHRRMKKQPLTEWLEDERWVRADGAAVDIAALWSSVIAQAWRDATATIPKDRKATAERDRDEARRFLTDEYGDFARRRVEICEIVGEDPERLREKALELIGWHDERDGESESGGDRGKQIGPNGRGLPKMRAEAKAAQSQDSVFVSTGNRGGRRLAMPPLRLVGEANR